MYLRQSTSSHVVANRNVYGPNIGVVTDAFPILQHEGRDALARAAGYPSRANTRRGERVEPCVARCLYPLQENANAYAELCTVVKHIIYQHRLTCPPHMMSDGRGCLRLDHCDWLPD